MQDRTVPRYLIICYITRSNDIPSYVYLDSTSACSDKDIATLFNKYFHSVFTTSCSALPPFIDLPYMCKSISTIDIQDLDIYQALLSLDPSKAMGCDCISPKILHSCAFWLYVPPPSPLCVCHFPIVSYQLNDLST